MTSFLQMLTRLFDVLVQDFAYLVGLLLLGLVLAAALAPLGSLRWWRSGQARRAAIGSAPAAVPLSPGEAAPQRYLIYLSGIGAVSDDILTPGELALLHKIDAAVHDIEVLDDVFAYSVTNTGLIAKRPLGRFWNWCYHNKQAHTPLAALGGLINLRNLLQVAVSADSRYGPMFSYGVAEVMVQQLLAHGYSLANPAPLVLLGYSGGGQVALGAARFLQATLQVPVQVISLAGVLSNDPGVASVQRLDHLYGTLDGVQRLGELLFPGRWPPLRQSRWNQALAAGRITFSCLGPMGHSGPQGYLDAESHLDDGHSFLDATAAAIIELLRQPHTAPAAQTEAEKGHV